MARGSISRASQSLDKYLQEIGEVPLLTPEEEIELAQRIKQNDQDALEKLTKANLRFVVSVAKQYQNQGLSLGARPKAHPARARRSVAGVNASRTRQYSGHGA